MLAHLKKILALLSVYNYLQMSQELRESLIEALPNPNDDQDHVGPLDKVACLVTIYFTDEEKYTKVEGHN